MRESGREEICELCLAYVSGECTAEETAAFERHLPGCSFCRAEVDDLRRVWEVLPADMERIEPPEDLKKQVLDAAFEADRSGNASRRLFANRWLTIAAAAALLLLAAGTFWNVQLIRDRAAAPLPIEQALSVPAAQIERLVSLQPQSSGTERSYGVACIVNNGQSKQFIVYVFGAKQTTGTEAYQVWLIRGNERTSAGTFRVGERGIGVLAMPIASGTLSFDSIGITLEPDDSGAQPRGTKVFGST